MEISKEKLIEINKEIEVVLVKYGVTLQPTMGISIVPVPAEIVKEAEVISPIQQNDINNPEA